MFKMLAGVDMVHVPYRGAGPALTDVLGGQAHLYFSPLTATIGHIRDGKLRVLAVTTTDRAATLPDVPAVGELVKGYDATQLYGIIAPKNTPAEIVGKLNKEVNAILADPKAKARLADLGGQLHGVDCARGHAPRAEAAPAHHLGVDPPSQMRRREVFLQRDHSHDPSSPGSAAWPALADRRSSQSSHPRRLRRP
jgi:hypothetical protein